MTQPTGAMWLIYHDRHGRPHYQHWRDLPEAGTLIDPDDGEDMELVGWTTEVLW